jgi:hypothetical protein
MRPRCGLCGRFAVRLDAGYCSPRCAELSETYTSPPVAAAALAAPTTAFAATLLAAGGGLTRLGADSWEELEAAVEAAGAEVFTLQQFATRRGQT